MSVHREGEGYLKLIGEHFSYILYPQPSSSSASSSSSSSSSFPSSSMADSLPSLILGRKLPLPQSDVFAIAADKNISRQHAQIHWLPFSSSSLSPPSSSSPSSLSSASSLLMSSPRTSSSPSPSGSWCLTCLGKNGMFVDDVFVSGDERIRLDWKGRDWIKMQIGDVIFFVIQPIQTKLQQQQQQQQNSHNNQHSATTPTNNRNHTTSSSNSIGGGSSSGNHSSMDTR